MMFLKLDKMKKNYLIAVLLMSLTFGSLFGQDIIVLKNGNEIKSKVLEINDKEVKYKKFDNLEGPTISMLKAEIFMIKYQNGTKDVLNNDNSSAVGNENSSAKKYVDAKPNRVGLYLNPLGFVQFGPMLGTEITRNSSLIIDAHIRFSSLGVLSYVVSANVDDGAPYKISGLAIGGGVKSFMPSRIGGFYIGGVFEYGWATNYYAQDKSWIWQSDSKNIVAMASIGYKFRFKSGFYINTGAFLGGSYTFSDKWYYTKNYNNDSSIHVDSGKTVLAGMLEVSFGIEL
jgi:hypothetical protein